MSKTRREFARTLVLAGAVAPLVALDAPAQPAPKPSALGDALANVVFATYGQHLTPQEMERVSRDMQEGVPALESFRKFKLVNGDEPDFTFQSLAERW